MNYYSRLTIGNLKYGTITTQDATHNIVGKIKSIDPIKRIATFDQGHYSAPFRIVIDDVGGYWRTYLQTAANRILKGTQVLLEYVGIQSGNVYQTIAPYIIDHVVDNEDFIIELVLEPPELDQKFPQADEVFNTTDFPDVVEPAAGLTWPFAYGLINTPDDKYSGPTRCWRIGSVTVGDDTYQLYFASVGKCWQILATWDGDVLLPGGDVANGFQVDVGVFKTWIISGGTGYSAGNLVFSGGGGSGAAGSYTVDGSGAIDSVTINSWGSGYTSVPTVTPSHAGNGDADLLAEIFTFLKYKWIADTNVIDEDGNPADTAPDVLYANIHGIEVAGAWAWNPFTAIKYKFDRYGIGYNDTSRQAMQTICTAEGYYLNWWHDKEQVLKHTLSEFSFNFFKRWFIGDACDIDWYKIPDPGDPEIKEFLEEEIFECIDLEKDKNKLTKVKNRIRYRFWFVWENNHWYRSEVVVDEDSEFNERYHDIDFLIAVGTNADAYPTVALALATKHLNYQNYVAKYYKIMIDIRTFFFYQNLINLGFGSVIKANHRKIVVTGLKYEVYGLEPDLNQEKIWLYLRSLSG